VAAATRSRVLVAAETLGYRPNLRARDLRQRSSCCIGLIIPNLMNAYYTALADEASQLLAKAGYQLMLASTRDDPEIERDTVDTMMGQDVAGLMWVPTSPDEKLLKLLDDHHIPVVSIVRQMASEKIDSVVFEDFGGSYAATEHLISLGHRCIGYVGGDTKHSSNSARWRGYKKAMEDAGLPIDERLIRLGTPQSTWGEVATHDLLLLPQPPTAIFAASNAIIPGVVRVLRRHKVQVPAEVSLICFDDVDWFSFSLPPITAISTSHSKLARTAVELLLRRIEESGGVESPAVSMEIHFELVLRSSTGLPRSQPSVLMSESDSR
jgi:LacI family transcriptional regulator